MVSFNIEKPLYYLGDEIIGSAIYLPDPSKKTPKGISCKLGWRTEGRGNTDNYNYLNINLNDQQHDFKKDLHLDFKVIIPHDAPISYDGELIRIKWAVRVRLDVAWAFDPNFERLIIVNQPLRD